jgi:hypothetical protein
MWNNNKNMVTQKRKISVKIKQNNVTVTSDARQ